MENFQADTLMAALGTTQAHSVKSADAPEVAAAAGAGKLEVDAMTRSLDLDSLLSRLIGRSVLP